MVNFELPNVEEDYVHRIGRTGRAGRSGEAISLVAPDEEKLLKGIERMTKQRIPDGDLQGFDASSIEAEKPEVREPANRARSVASARHVASATSRRKRCRAEGAQSPQQSKTRKPARDGVASEAQGVARPPQLPPDRAPDEFLDDEVDNFGNRVDYVSPYQSKQNRGRRTGGQAQPAPHRVQLELELPATAVAAQREARASVPPLARARRRATASHAMVSRGARTRVAASMSRSSRVRKWPSRARSSR